MADAGHDVYVIMRDRQDEYPGPPHFDSDRVRTSTLRPLLAKWLRNGETGWGPAASVLCGLVRRVGEHADRIRFVRLVSSIVRRGDFDALIGVDAGGMLAAGCAARPEGPPLVHWSLEVESGRPERDPIRRSAVRAARAYQRRAAVTIVQDTLRAQQLEHGLGGRPRGVVHLVPNAPSGPVVARRGRLFHQRFGLAQSQRVILCAGGILPELMAAEIAAAAASWPREWTLVFHERSHRSPNDPFLEKLLELGGERVRLSLEPVSYDALAELFSSADVSLALYSAHHGDNVRVIGSASGKVAWSLRAGVPVVCSDSPGLSELVRVTGCGMVVSAPAELESAISAVLADHAAFRERAWRCYQERLEFSVAFRPVLDELVRVTGRAAP
jgi:glycosyltransferase involved in cell wall biosynthesis